MANNEGYNGWTNYPTWNIKLWMDNDQGSQEYWLDRARETLEQSTEDHDPDDSVLTAEQEARYALAENLKDDFEQLVDESNGTAGPLADLMGWALAQVNWSEIAESLMDDAAEIAA